MDHSDDRKPVEPPAAEGQPDRDRLVASFDRIRESGKTDPERLMSPVERAEFRYERATARAEGYKALLETAIRVGLIDEVERLRILAEEWDGQSDLWSEAVEAVRNPDPPLGFDDEWDPSDEEPF